MKFVLDTNVFLKALIKNSVVRGIILGSHHEFLIPAYLDEEFREHIGEVEKKSGLSSSEIESVVDALLARIRVVPADKVLSEWKEAEGIIEKVDKGDVAFIAAALSTDCDGIWSDDRHLKRQDRVEVWTTKDVARLGNRAWGSLRLRRKRLGLRSTSTKVAFMSHTSL